MLELKNQTKTCEQSLEDYLYSIFIRSHSDALLKHTELQ